MKLYSLIASGVSFIKPTVEDLKASGAPELVIKGLEGHVNASFIRIRLSPTDAPNVNGDWVTAEGAAKRVKSLILQPVNLAADLTEHNKLEPIGVVYNAFLDEKNDDIMADAVLWKRYFPNEVAVIEAMKDQLGGSWEIAAFEKGIRYVEAAVSKAMNINAEKIRLIEDDYDFTGFSILKQTAAAAQFRTRVEELVASQRAGSDKKGTDENKKEVKANMLFPLTIGTQAQFDELIASALKESEQGKRLEALEASVEKYKTDLTASNDANAKVIAALAEVLPADKRSTDPVAMAQAIKDAEASKTIHAEAEKQFEAMKKDYDEKDKDEVIAILEAGARKEMTVEQASKLIAMRKGANPPATKGIHANVNEEDGKLSQAQIDATASRMAGKGNGSSTEEIVAAAVTATMKALAKK